MQLGVFAVMIAVAVYATDRWAVQRTAVYPMTMTSAALWSWLTLRGTRITSNIDGAYTETYPYLGYVFLFLALTSILAMIVHYQWGLPNTGDDEEIDADPADNQSTTQSDSA